MVAYPARLEAEGENMVVLTLPDVPELVVVAGAEEEALGMAPALLGSILAGYAWEDRPLPVPSRIRGAPLVTPKAFRFSGE
jgi:predicted RNase H-like HicB family nuclease